eukprot:Hpha_TRINITY_DN13849_c0_g3::TRINITY_DN13849_c0_g3_i2::g.69849::m.69849
MEDGGQRNKSNQTCVGLTGVVKQSTGGTQHRRKFGDRKVPIGRAGPPPPRRIFVHSWILVSVCGRRVARGPPQQPQPLSLRLFHIPRVHVTIVPGTYLYHHAPVVHKWHQRQLRPMEADDTVRTSYGRKQDIPQRFLIIYLHTSARVQGDLNFPPQSRRRLHQRLPITNETRTTGETKHEDQHWSVSQGERRVEPPHPCEPLLELVGGLHRRRRGAVKVCPLQAKSRFGASAIGGQNVEQPPQPPHHRILEVPLVDDHNVTLALKVPCGRRHALDAHGVHNLHEQGEKYIVKPVGKVVTGQVWPFELPKHDRRFCNGCTALPCRVHRRIVLGPILSVVAQPSRCQQHLRMFVDVKKLHKGAALPVASIRHMRTHPRAAANQALRLAESLRVLWVPPEPRYEDLDRGFPEGVG